jgi:hypothetical protein
MGGGEYGENCTIPMAKKCAPTEGRDNQNSILPKALGLLGLTHNVVQFAVPK